MSYLLEMWSNLCFRKWRKKCGPICVIKSL